MSDRAYTGRSESPPRTYKGEPSITTFAGLKKEANTAVIQYFAPVVAVINAVAATAGLPTIRWRERIETNGDGRKKDY